MNFVKIGGFPAINLERIDYIEKGITGYRVYMGMNTVNLNDEWGLVLIGMLHRQTLKEREAKSETLNS